MKFPTKLKIKKIFGQDHQRDSGQDVRKRNNRQNVRGFSKLNYQAQTPKMINRNFKQVTEEQRKHKDKAKKRNQEF